MASWAVMKASGMPPASTRSRFAGTRAQCAAAVTRYSAWPPPATMPMTRSPGQGAATAEPDGLDDTGELQPGDVGRNPGRGGIAAGPLEQIGPVDAGAVNPDEHLVGRRLGDRPVLDHQAAAFLDDEGPHDDRA